MPSGDIKRKHCEEFLGERIQEVAEGTVRTYRSHLSAAFNRAVAEEIINRNPFEHVNMGDVVNRYSAELKGRDKTERETFTVEEMRTILFDLPQPYRDLAAVSYYSGGQRIGDCITLTWDQVDFKNNLIHFCTEKTAKKLAHPLMPELRSRLLARKKLSTVPNERRVFPALDEARKRSSGLVSTQFTNLLRAYGILKEKQLRSRRADAGPSPRRPSTASATRLSPSCVPQVSLWTSHVPLWPRFGGCGERILQGLHRRAEGRSECSGQGRQTAGMTYTSPKA